MDGDRAEGEDDVEQAGMVGGERSDGVGPGRGGFFVVEAGQPGAVAEWGEIGHGRSGSGAGSPGLGGRGLSK